jgi:hypothetical protein
VTELTDTHRRARLRGRESVARWRVEGASWVGWLYGLTGVLSVAFGAIGGTGASVVGGVVNAGICAAMVFGIHRMRRGSRVAACAVVAVPVVLKLLSAHPLLWSFWDVAVVAVLANGAWGAFQLGAVRRDAAGLPPAPEPRVRFGRAFG